MYSLVEAAAGAPVEAAAGTPVGAPVGALVGAPVGGRACPVTAKSFLK